MPDMRHVFEIRYAEARHFASVAKDDARCVLAHTLGCFGKYSFRRRREGRREANQKPRFSNRIIASRREQFIQSKTLLSVKIDQVVIQKRISGYLTDKLDNSIPCENSYSVLYDISFIYDQYARTHTALRLATRPILFDGSQRALS